MSKGIADTFPRNDLEWVSEYDLQMTEVHNDALQHERYSVELAAVRRKL